MVSQITTCSQTAVCCRSMVGYSQCTTAPIQFQKRTRLVVICTISPVVLET